MAKDYHRTQSQQWSLATELDPSAYTNEGEVNRVTDPELSIIFGLSDILDETKAQTRLLKRIIELLEVGYGPHRS